MCLPGVVTRTTVRFAWQEHGQPPLPLHRTACRVRASVAQGATGRHQGVARSPHPQTGDFPVPNRIFTLTRVRLCIWYGCSGSAERSGYCADHDALNWMIWAKLRDRSVHVPRTAVGQCAVADCDRPARTRGWCRRHYDRWWFYGNPLDGPTHPA